MDKQMFVFAGPNGSGKSTAVERALTLGQCPPNFICPDNYVPPDKKNDAAAYIKAMQETEAMRFSEIAFGRSFSFETVLSTPEKLSFIQYAKRQGYYVRVIFVTTERPEIKIARVQSRVLQGGHDVPTDKIISRYEKSLGLMFDVILAADAADVYDNSGDDLRFVAAKVDGVICVCKDPPRQIEKYLAAKVRQFDMQLGRIL